MDAKRANVATIVGDAEVEHANQHARSGLDADPVARWMCDDPQQYLRGPMCMLISWLKIQLAPGTRAVTADGVETLERLTLLHRQSTASSSATVISTGRAPALTPQRCRRCTSTRRPRPPCWRSRRRGAASTTSPNRTHTSPQIKRDANSASTRASG